MARTEKLEITLPAEQAELIRQRVARGDYESADQMVAAAIEALDDESWLPPPDILRRLVQQALDDPRPAVPAEQVFADLRDYLEEKRGRAAQP